MGNLVLALLLGSTVSVPSPRSADPLPLVGQVVRHRVEQGQTLRSIGARLGVDPSALARANGLRATDSVAPGDELEAPARHLAPARIENGIVVNLPQRMLFLWRDGKVEKSWPIAVGGAKWRTPRGSFTVAEMEEDPSWEVPRSIQAEMRRKGQRVRTRVAAGPANPLGTRWMGLSVGSVGIHGTNAPGSIYRYATHGCVRMHPEDVEDLYDRVEIGLPVQIVYEPVLLTLDEGKVWIEGHPDPYALGRPGLQAAHEQAEALGVGDRVDWTLAAEILKTRDGVPREVGHGDRPQATD